MSSDFLHTKLPSSIKKMIALSYSKPSDRRAARKAFISAHAAHVVHKLKRNDTPVAQASLEE